VVFSWLHHQFLDADWRAIHRVFLLSFCCCHGVFVVVIELLSLLN
jgi:hypothetical protein